MAKEWAQAFYHSKAWRTVRQRVLIRDGYTCRICGARATAVDHIQELTPENIGNRNVSLNMSNLQALCHDCHSKAELDCTRCPVWEHCADDEDKPFQSLIEWLREEAEDDSSTD